MRRVLFLVLFFLLTATFLAAGTVSAITYQEGIRAAKSENKPLYLYFYTDS